jgi:hypothetical protein
MSVQRDAYAVIADPIGNVVGLYEEPRSGT